MELFFVTPFVTLATLSEEDTHALSQGSERRTSTREDSNTRFITAEKRLPRGTENFTAGDRKTRRLFPNFTEYSYNFHWQGVVPVPGMMEPGDQFVREKLLPAMKHFSIFYVFTTEENIS